MLPPPQTLEIHDTQAAEKWKKFKRAWTNYALATELNTKSEAVPVATLLTVIGEEAREVFSTFTDWVDDDEAKILPVLAKFEQYCQPRKNTPFERYRFNRRSQEQGESYDQYRTALRKLGESCEFQTITPDEILRDRLVFGIRDPKVRERLLRESNLTLGKTDEICRAAESMMIQMKEVDGNSGATICAVKSEVERTNQEGRSGRECWNCGRKHEFNKKELCPAYGKTCYKCRKPNHFAVKCRSRQTLKEVKTLDEQEEILQTGVPGTGIDDSQLVTLKLESGNCLRFQVDTGAQCNVVPLDLYKKATKDHNLRNVKSTSQKIIAYGGTQIPVYGIATIEVSRGSSKYKLACKLVDKTNTRPLLGRKACVGMKIVV